MDDLLADFLTETNESLAELDLALVKLERAPGDAPTLSLIFRHVHTIKGTCGFLGLPRLEHTAHAAENVLGRLRDGTLAVSSEVVSCVLAAVDAIKSIVNALATTGSEPPGDDAALVEALNAIAEGRSSAPMPAAKPPAAPRVEAKVAPKIELNIAAPAEPKADAPAAGAAPEPMADPAPGAAADAAGGDAHAAQTIRVAVDVLEDLMTLVSELVLTRNQLLQLARRQENSGFAVPLQRLSQITSDLQEGVMKTRMQPIGNAWNKLPRLVRDLARDLGKKIELVMHGAETELDRQVLELIKDPLTHMVRNSADHGLESPAERRAAGKPEGGRIALSACHEGGHIIIEIADDGRGLPVDKIRAKALSRGLASEAELATMNEAADFALHLPPGLFHRRGHHRRQRPRRWPGRGQDQYRTHRRRHRPAQRQRTRHGIHHQDPADAGHRLGADRRCRRGAVRHSAVVGGGTGARRRRRRRGGGRRGEPDRADRQHRGAAPAGPAAAAD